MYYGLNILEDTGIHFLNQFDSRNLIPRNCVIAEWLATCRFSGFWQNEHVFSCFTVLVTVSEGST